MKTGNAFRTSNPVKRVVLLAGILLMPGLFIAGPGSATITGVQPPQYGNWDITTPTIARNETITLAGNLIVRTTLTLENTTIKFNCGYNGQYGIDVLYGGCLNIMDLNGDASNMTSTNQYAYTFRIREGATATIINSEIHKCGYYTGQIDYRSGLLIESSNVLIKGCAISNNYIGMIFNSIDDIEVDSTYEDSSSIITQISNNGYGVYAIGSTNIEFINTIFNNNSVNDFYLDISSTAHALDCYPSNPTKGGPGSLVSDTTPGRIYNDQDYFEIEYDEDGQTFRYAGWTSGAGGSYASSYCVVRRGHDYTIKENLAAMKGFDVLHNPYPGWAKLCGIEFFITTDIDDSRELLTNQGNTHVISISTNYPIGYFILDCYAVWKTAPGQYFGIFVTWMTVYIIFDLPSTTGLDDATDLTSNGRAEYIYMDDDGIVSGLPSNIDLCGPYYKMEDENLEYFYYGVDSDNPHAGINFNDENVFPLACAAVCGIDDEWEAATRIQAVVNILVHGDWQTGGATLAFTDDVKNHLTHVTKDMTSSPLQNIENVHNHPATTSDSLGLHCSDPANGYMYTQNILKYQCHDFAAISTAFYRAIGIAARQVTGYSYSGGLHYNWTYHVWTEIWIPDNNGQYTSYDNQWDVFDACGVDLDDGNEPVDDDTDCPDGASRLDYFDNLNTADFGTPLAIYAILITDQGAQQITLTGEYT
jgi:hypothetical protein